jgi:BirA family transcriptional regulator, biotin operon repressor / biotin---[acetyl-CoA-carboxylase] ligase
LQSNIFSGAFVGRYLLTLKEVDSTNTFLKLLLSNNEPLPEGAVIMAEDQTAGRGQRQNKWFSTAGESLTFSILLNPTFLPLQQQFDLTRVVSLGVYDALKPLVQDQVKIKWPNDIYIGNKKLGGILIENQVQGNAIKNSVIGIGLNINQSHFPEWVPNATSLKQTLQSDHDPHKIMSEICRCIEQWYIKLKDGSYRHIQDAYIEALYLMDIESRFKVHDTIFAGTIIGVTEQGLLEVKVGAERKTYDLKGITFLHDQ